MLRLVIDTTETANPDCDWTFLDDSEPSSTELRTILNETPRD